MILYYSVHYPKKDREVLLIEAMRQAGKVLKELPGCIFDNAFQDAESGRIMAMTIWESEEALQAAYPAMGEILKDIPFAEWEARPTEFHTLKSLW